MVFCAGSALQTLLSAGIKPGFQVEKENNETDLPPLTGPFGMLVHHSFELRRDDAFRCWWPVSEG